MEKTGKACELLGVHPNTLRRWANEGKIKCIRPTGKVRYYDVEGFLGNKEEAQRRKVIYARVSSKGQQDDLSNQIRYLRERYPHHELIEDVGSGLNFKRKGFLSLLDGITSGAFEEVVVSHRDRLCRFGFQIFEHLAKQNNCRILVLNNTQVSPQEELVQDLISIIHVFSCRIYGLRKYSDQIKKDKDISKEGRQRDV